MRVIARVAGVVATCATALILAQAADAQMSLPPSVGQFQGITGAPAFGNQTPSQPGYARSGPPAPAGLPGAQSAPNAVAPPSQPAAMMEPTDALFDAINRGDIAAARDAVSRGADMGGHNLLGMTPIQLSVDLARNDITFMLLAAGGGQSTSPGGPSAAQLLAGKAPAKPVRQAERKPARQVQTVAAPAPPQTPRLFAGNGGTPIPNAGFLGFDPGR
ncbi:MAG TPA: hypothetical protein VLI93_13465 [Acetobacteraceae bacterium]|nr:hypothetical protein [Acetobacteraceae bacterium]